jgi:hypothetical protein
MQSPHPVDSPKWRTVGGQIKLGHLKFNLCKSDHSIVSIFVSVYIICHTKVNLFVTAVIKRCKFVNFDLCDCHFCPSFICPPTVH